MKIGEIWQIKPDRTMQTQIKLLSVKDDRWTYEIRYNMDDDWVFATECRNDGAGNSSLCVAIYTTEQIQKMFKRVA